jgi:RHS repeat-associated protein
MTSSTVTRTSRTYAYNGDGLLQSRTGSGATTFVWDSAMAPGRELKQGSDNIVYGLGPLYVVKADSSTLTFVRDGSKNVRAELNSTSIVTAAFRYRAYGPISQSTAALPTYLGYAGQLPDPSGLIYMRARWYDPATARFVARDPLAGAFTATTNAYFYANGNPLLMSDASGLCGPMCVVGAGAVAVALLPVEIPVALVITVGLGVVAFGAGAIWIINNVSKPTPSQTSAGTGGNTAQPPAPRGPGDDDDYIYRGVSRNHFGYDDARSGVARPRGGSSTPAQHNEGFTDSPYTSWTTDLDVARDFAGEDGVVLRIRRTGQNLVQSPDAYNESEILIQGIFRGAEVFLPWSLIPTSNGSRS